MVVDCLSEDKQALSTCSLVCKNWTPRSRHNLWRRISLHNGHGRAESLTDFRELISHSPTLASYIRLFRFSQSGSQAAREPSYGTFILFLQLMSNLEELDLTSVCFTFDALQGPLEHGRKIRRMSLEGISFDSIGNFDRFILSFECLQELRLSTSVYLDDSTEDTDFVEYRSLALERLEIGFNDNPRTCMSWLALFDAIEVKTLRIISMMSEFAHDQGVQLFQRAWRKCISRAESLELERSCFGREPKFLCRAVHWLMIRNMILGQQEYGLGPSLWGLAGYPSAIDLSGVETLRSVTAISEASELRHCICLLLHEVLQSLPEGHRLNSCVAIAKNYRPTCSNWSFDGAWTFGDDDDDDDDGIVTPFADKPLGQDLTTCRLPCDYLAVRLLYPDRCDARLYDALQPLRNANIPVRVEYTTRDGAIHEYRPSEE